MLTARTTMGEIVHTTCANFDIPKEARDDFRRITLGCPPGDERFFRKIVHKGHYKQALIRILQEMPCR